MYCNATNLDEPTRTRTRAIAVGVSGISYYWHTYPAFAAECRTRLQQILADTATR